VVLRQKCDVYVVAVHIKGIHDGRVFEDRDVKFVIGDGSEAGIVPGVELGVKKCRRGERLRLCVKASYAYKDVGCSIYNIPPGADLTYEVEMKNFVRVS
jgi:FK506-binding protein 4/5